MKNICPYLRKLEQCFFYSPRKSKNLNLPSKLEVDHVFLVIFALLMFYSEVLLPSRTGNKLNLKKLNVKPRKIKLEYEQIFPK